MLFEFISTLLHIALVTSALSPVNTITLIPALFNFFIDSFALSFGGSKNPINPNKTMFFSSCTPKFDTLSISFF